jgi:alpha-NAC-related protein
MFEKKTPEEKMQDMMKKFNINIEPISATEVVIKSGTRNIVIKNPEVMRTKIMGRDVYQITGRANESNTLNEEDINLVMRKTGRDRETVVQKLEELNNDLAKAIIELKSGKKKKRK